MGLYVLLILSVSSIPNLRTPGFSESDKVAHFCEYFVLGLLCQRAVGWRGWRAWSVGVAIVAVVAFGDENYQRTVPGRMCSVYDWTADVIGGSAGALVWPFLMRRWTKFAARKGSVRESS